MTEIKKRYFVITAALLIVGFVFADRFSLYFDTNNDHSEVISQNEVVNDSIMVIADKKIKRIKELQKLQIKDQSALDSLKFIMNSTTDQQSEEIRKKIKDLERKKSEYNTQLTLLTEDSVVYNIIKKDTVVHNIIEKDSVVYNITEKDTVIVLPIVDTIYLADSIQIAPKYIKNKFYKK